VLVYDYFMNIIRHYACCITLHFASWHSGTYHYVMKHSPYRPSMVSRYQYMCLICDNIDHDNHRMPGHTEAWTLFARKVKSPSKNIKQKTQTKKWIVVNHNRNILNYLILRLTITQNNSTQQMTKPNTAHTTMRLNASFTENFRWLAAGCREKKKEMNELLG
jgi:hypothetical protein